MIPLSYVDYKPFEVSPGQFFQGISGLSEGCSEVKRLWMQGFPTIDYVSLEKSIPLATITIILGRFLLYNPT